MVYAIRNSRERKEEIDQWLEEDTTKCYLSGKNVTDLLVLLFAIFCIFQIFQSLKGEIITLLSLIKEIKKQDQKLLGVIIFPQRRAKPEEKWISPNGLALHTEKAND